MARKFSQIRDQILPICSTSDFDKITQALKNPVQHSYVIGMLENLLERVKGLALSPSDLLEITTILEDTLVETRIICQDAKCDPFNYMMARRLDHRA